MGTILGIEFTLIVSGRVGIRKQYFCFVFYVVFQCLWKIIAYLEIPNLCSFMFLFEEKFIIIGVLDVIELQYE